MKIRRTVCAVLSFAVTASLICACSSAKKAQYGVFLDYEGDLSDLSGYETVVIDAQYVDAQDIKRFRDEGHTVYSYINVGSLENFRDYYDEYKDLGLGVYEHWEDEIWMDMSSDRWTGFLIDELAPSLIDAGIDGFFVDNCDVYYHYHSDAVFDGLTTVMTALRRDDMPVLINGGDTYLDEYVSRGGDPRDVVTGINQESVFTSIDWEEGTYGRASDEDHEYFMEHITRYSDMGLDIYLLEYGATGDLAREIVTCCDERDWKYYISGDISLKAP